MTKKQKKWAIILSCGSAVTGSGIPVLEGPRILLHLPDFADLKSVTLTQRGGEEAELVDADGEDVLFILQGNGRTTRTESVQDAPVNVDGWIKVDMNFWKGGAATLFVYQRSSARDGEYFIEQPYNGIYEISGDEYNAIEKYAG